MNRSLFSFLFAAAIVAVSGTQMAAQTMRERVKPYLVRSLAAGDSLVGVSAASGEPVLAPGELASLFGQSLSSQSQPGSAPYPTSLGGVGVQIVDSSGKSEALRLLYVSPEQINLIVPADIATALLPLTSSTALGTCQVGPSRCSP